MKNDSNCQATVFLNLIIFNAMIVGVTTPLFTYTWLLYQLLLWDESLLLYMRKQWTVRFLWINLDTALMNINKLSGTSEFLAYLPYGQVNQKVKFCIADGESFLVIFHVFLYLSEIILASLAPKNFLNQLYINNLSLLLSLLHLIYLIVPILKLQQRGHTPKVLHFHSIPEWVGFF